MKTITLAISFCFIITASSLNASVNEVFSILNGYKTFLDKGTLENQDWSRLPEPPKTRFHTFSKAFELFINNNGRVIVELGTTRSFVHGGLIGCNSDDTSYWTPEKPENWDWGAGCFTRVAAECFNNSNVEIHTIDLAQAHINRCRIITAPFKHMINYYVCSSVDFLANTNLKIDLLYMDTGDMTPIEPTALLQLEEARMVVHRDLIAPGGLILIDDVKNQTPKKFGETSDLGKAKYALPYLLKHGFELVENEYQILLRKK